MTEPPAAPAALRVDRLSVVAGGATILSEVSLELAARGRLAVVGRSGAGKTTLLSAIAGLTPLSGGAIQVGGAVCAADGAQRTPPARRGVGLVFQDLGLWDHMTVGESIAFAARGTRAERRARARDHAARVGLEARLSAFPHELSGGEQQRLALARALAGEPRLLLLDEPFSHLDPPLRRDLSALVLEHAERAGVGLVVASHALEDVRRLSTSLCVLDAGRVVEAGETVACLAAPQSRELRELFDLAPA